MAKISKLESPIKKKVRCSMCSKEKTCVIKLVSFNLQVNEWDFKPNPDQEYWFCSLECLKKWLDLHAWAWVEQGLKGPWSEENE